LTVIAINPATRKRTGGEALPVSRPRQSGDHDWKNVSLRKNQVADLPPSTAGTCPVMKEALSAPSPIAHAPKNQCGVLIGQNG
jgi:hypothetical protein